MGGLSCRRCCGHPAVVCDRPCCGATTTARRSAPLRMLEAPISHLSRGLGLAAPSSTLGARCGWNDLRQLGVFDGPALCVLQPRKTAKRRRIGTGVGRRHLTPKQEADMARPAITVLLIGSAL